MMIDVLTVNKWAFMISAEVAFWLLASAGLILRYWLELKQAAVVVLLLIVANELFIILLAVLDYLQRASLANIKSLPSLSCEVRLALGGGMLYFVLNGRSFTGGKHDPTNH